MYCKRSTYILYKRSAGNSQVTGQTLQYKQVFLFFLRRTATHTAPPPKMTDRAFPEAPESKSATRLNTFVRNFDKEFTALLRRDRPKGVPDSQAEVRQPLAPRKRSRRTRMSSRTSDRISVCICAGKGRTARGTGAASGG